MVVQALSSIVHVVHQGHGVMKSFRATEPLLVLPFFEPKREGALVDADAAHRARGKDDDYDEEETDVS